MRIVTETEFAARISAILSRADVRSCRAVTGPGRSGAVASVYASHILGIPWVPLAAVESIPSALRPVLVVDTAAASGATLRKAARRVGEPSISVAVYEEPPRVSFWYEWPVEPPDAGEGR